MRLVDAVRGAVCAAVGHRFEMFGFGDSPIVVCRRCYVLELRKPCKCGGTSPCVCASEALRIDREGSK